jgi:hypothetical protein
MERTSPGLIPANLQLNTRSSLIHSWQRDWQSSGDIYLSEERPRSGFLQAGHVSVRDQVSLQLGKTQEHVGIAKADSDQRRLPFDQLIQGFHSRLWQGYAARLT